MQQDTKKILWLNCIIVIICFFISILFSYKPQPTEGRYSSDSNIMPYAAVSSETVSYTSKEETYEETAYGMPIYYQSSQLPNSCGPTAGAIVVGFYDKYYEELISDYDPCLSTGRYKRADKVYIPQLMSELYTLMRTNIDDVGVSKSDCLSGLRSYVRQQNRAITYNSVFSSKRVSEASFVSAIHNNQPTLLFCRKMDLYLVSTGINSDILSKSAYVGAHVAVAYGIYTVKYYNGNNNFRTDKYIKINTGFSEVPSGYLRLEDNDWCNDALSVSIT